MVVVGLHEEAVIVAEVPRLDDRPFGAFARISAFLSRWAGRFVAFYRRQRDTKGEEPIRPDSGSIVNDSPGSTEQRVVKTALTAKQKIRLRK